MVMKLGISLPDELARFADAEAVRRGTSRSGLIAELLEAERLRRQVTAYIDRHGWDIAESTEEWRRYQQRRMSEEYADDEW